MPGWTNTKKLLYLLDRAEISRRINPTSAVLFWSRVPLGGGGGGVLLFVNLEQ